MLRPRPSAAASKASQCNGCEGARSRAHAVRVLRRSRSRARAGSIRGAGGGGPERQAPRVHLSSGVLALRGGPGRAALVAALLLAALLALTGPAPAWGQAPAQAPAAAPGAPLAPADQALPPPGEGLPADLGPERPVTTPAPLQPGRPDPRSGLAFGLGLPYADVRSERLNVRLKGGKLSQTGVLVHVEGVSDPFRFGYVRQLYRADLPAGTTLEGIALDGLSFDSDQLWVFHGFRPHHSLYAGYGLGWQRRLIRLLDRGVVLDARTESGGLGGVLVDWALGLPFSLQLRAFGDLKPGFIQARAASLQLSFIAAF